MRGVREESVALVPRLASAAAMCQRTSTVNWCREKGLPLDAAQSISGANRRQVYFMRVKYQ